MKKILFALAILVTGITLTSFVIDKQTSNKNEMISDDYEYKPHGKILAYDYENNGSITLYIFYRVKDNGERVYVCTTTPNIGNYQNLIYKNQLYHNCNDRRSGYKYRAAGGYWYFNADLPYFSEP